MTQKIRNFILVALTVLGLGTMTLIPASDTYATTATNNVTKGFQATDAGNGKTLQQNIRRVVNIILFLLGAIAVLMIILGGVRYVLSNGEASQVTAAKNTILYAVIGLVVAILAYAIVNFVVTQITK